MNDHDLLEFIGVKYTRSDIDSRGGPSRWYSQAHLSIAKCMTRDAIISELQKYSAEFDKYHKMHMTSPDAKSVGRVCTARKASAYGVAEDSARYVMNLKGALEVNLFYPEICPSEKA